MSVYPITCVFLNPGSNCSLHSAQCCSITVALYENNQGLSLVELGTSSKVELYHYTHPLGICIRTQKFEKCFHSTDIGSASKNLLIQTYPYTLIASFHRYLELSRDRGNASFLANLKLYDEASKSGRWGNVLYCKSSTRKVWKCNMSPLIIDDLTRLFDLRR